MESCVGEGGEEKEVDEGEEDDRDEGDTNKRTLEVGSLGSLGNKHACPFILPKMWIVNDFLPKMTVNILRI